MPQVSHPHLKLNVDNVKELDNFKYKTRNMGPKNSTEDDQEDEPEPEQEPVDNRQKAEVFRGSLLGLSHAQTARYNNRNASLKIPRHIDYIKITFHGQFNIASFFNRYYNTYGLLAVNYTKFNTVVLFAVIDEAKFSAFLQHINKFVIHIGNTSFDPNIIYINTFELYGTESIINLNLNEYPTLIKVHLTDFPLFIKEGKLIYDSLIQYLKDRNIRSQLNPVTFTLEVEQISPEQITELVDNFDIIQSVTSSLTTIIGPSTYQQPQRSYGFDITSPDDALPIIGVLDTGISNLTPLSSILIDDDRFNITGSSPFLDNADHGTGIAGLAALGRHPYTRGYRGTFDADARLLSMKILDGGVGNISDTQVLNLLRMAKKEYPAIKLFTLTICYTKNMKDDEEISRYAYELDRFSHENDCLIFICTSNNDHAVNNTSYNCNYFNRHECNLSSPAESMNNITIGASAEAFRDGAFMGLSPSKEFPTLFTRKYHVDLNRYFSIGKLNKRLFKPDIIEAGGDYEQSGSGMIGVGEIASMEVLSADPTRGFYSQCGTSFSTPLAANIAAKILGRYPTLKAQTLKALIVNSASLKNISLPITDMMLNRIAGHGVVNHEKAIFSNSNVATLILEDEISLGKINVYPIRLPEYFTTEDLGKKIGVLKITATLCFSFLPQPHNQLAYCPLMMAFSIFRNRGADSIKEDYNNALLRERWTQDGYYKSKPKLNSNVHKISFVIGVNELLTEDHTFKIAVNCSLGNQINPGQQENYKTAHPFSLVLTIEEQLKTEKLTGRLYQEIVNINDVEILTILDVDNSLDLEAEA